MPRTSLSHFHENTFCASSTNCGMHWVHAIKLFSRDSQKVFRRQHFVWDQMTFAVAVFNCQTDHKSKSAKRVEVRDPKSPPSLLVRFPNCQNQVGWGTWLVLKRDTNLVASSHLHCRGLTTNPLVASTRAGWQVDFLHCRGDFSPLCRTYTEGIFSPLCLQVAFLHCVGGCLELFSTVYIVGGCLEEKRRFTRTHHLHWHHI